MREILFRGKTDNGEWVEGFYGQFHNRPTLNEPNKHQIFVLFTEEEEKQNKGHFLSAIGGLWHTVIPETVGQYTGLTDKNGKKIFEGDVVRVYFVDGDEVGEIVYANSAFRFKCEDGVLGYCIDDTLECEVIGNIHDNPELLKGGAE